LTAEPFPPIFAAFFAIAILTRWHQICSDSSTALMAWFDVIQGVGYCIAIGALMAPCFKDLLPELMLCIAFVDKV